MATHDELKLWEARRKAMSETVANVAGSHQPPPDEKQIWTIKRLMGRLQTFADAHFKFFLEGFDDDTNPPYLAEVGPDKVEPPPNAGPVVAYPYQHVLDGLLKQVAYDLDVLDQAIATNKPVVLDVPMINNPVPTHGHWNILDIYSPDKKISHVSTD